MVSLRVSSQMLNEAGDELARPALVLHLDRIELGTGSGTRPTFPTPGSAQPAVQEYEG